VSSCLEKKYLDSFHFLRKFKVTLADCVIPDPTESTSPGIGIHACTTGGVISNLLDLSKTLAKITILWQPK
jgi:hypothetical protein